MNARPLRFAAALSLALTVVASARPAISLADPFRAMNVLRVTPPVPAPDVTFLTLEGSQSRLATLRGRPVLLTLFTTW